MSLDVKKDDQTTGKFSDQNVLNVRQVLCEILIMILIAVTVPMLVYLDVVVFFGNVREVSLTEMCQLLLLGVSTVLFTSGALRLPQMASYLWVMAIFSFLMCIRENDGLLDGIVHGFWLYPALVCIAVGVVIIWRNVDACCTGFLRHFSSRNGTLVFFGLFVVICFSRVFGSGELWRPVLADGYTQATKAAIQEGLELFGYAVFTFGIIGSWRNKFR